MYYSDYNRPPRPDSDYQVAPPEPPAPPAPAPKRTRRWPKVLALVLCCALVGGGAGVGGALLAQRAGSMAAALSGGTVIYQGTTPAVVTLSQPEEGKLLTPSEVYASNVDSVVGIFTRDATNVWGQTVARPATGTGFVISQDGYILTNFHVVDDAPTISVQFKDGTNYPATLVGYEEDLDVAVLKVEAQGLTPVRLGSSSELVVGQDVVAIGNPLGELTFSETSGIISALDKPVTTSEGVVMNLLQTDTALNSGNSGGPLFNLYGQVVGITNSKYSNNGSTQTAIEGIGFAVPIDDVKSVLTDLIERGYVTGKPYAGVSLSTANATEAARYGRSGGAYVQSVVSGSAADKAGLRQGDIITAMDDQPIDGQPAFLAARDAHKAGDTVTLTVDREAKLITLTLTFDEATPDNQSASQSQSGQNSGGQSSSGGQSGGYVIDPFSWFGW